MPNILAISRHFPPLSSAGASIRLVKLIKNLSTHGWKFTVLTQDPDQPVVAEDYLSDFLLEEIPSNTVVVRTRAPNIRFWLLPETSLWWGLRVMFQGLRLIRREQVDLIYAVAPVYTNAFIGAILRWLTGKPFFLDIKDDWIDSPRFLEKPVWRQYAERFLERLIIASATGVFLVTEPSYLHYKNRYHGKGHRGKFHYIPNGCDLDEYLPLRTRDAVRENHKFRIVSAAWGYKKEYRDIEPFLRAMSIFSGSISSSSSEIEVILLGNSLSNEYATMIEQLNLGQIIHETKAVKRKELVEWLWKADLFLLVQPFGNTTAISGTLYEYWATGKAPILLISEIGAASQLVDKYGLGWSFPFHEIDNIAQCIAEIYKAKINGTPTTISLEGIDNFDRKELAIRVADVFSCVLKG